MPTNQLRKELLERIKVSNFPGSIIDVFKAADQGIDLISQHEQQQQQQQQQNMQVANTPEEQAVGLREEHARGNTQASMAFPNVQPGQSFNTVGMKVPIDIQKVDKQGHLVESYKGVPPGIQDLPTGPYEGTIIESPSGYQKGGVKKDGGLFRKMQKGGPNIDPATTSPILNPVSDQSKNYSISFECDTKTDPTCGNPLSFPLQLGAHAGLTFTPGLTGQKYDIGPGWDHDTGQYANSRIRTHDFSPDLYGNIGGYLRTDFDRFAGPNLGSKMRDEHRNPYYSLRLGYNRRQPLITQGGAQTLGKGTDNVYATFGYDREPFEGSPGYNIWGHGSTRRRAITAGLEANYDLTNKQLTNVGAYGRYGMLRGNIGYNPQTRKPTFGFGIHKKFKKGGSYQEGGMGFEDPNLSDDLTKVENIVDKDTPLTGGVTATTPANYIPVLDWFNKYTEGDYFNTLANNYPNLSYDNMNVTDPGPLGQTADIGRLFQRGILNQTDQPLITYEGNLGKNFRSASFDPNTLQINMPIGTRPSVLAHELGHTDLSYLSIPFQNWVKDHNLQIQSGKIGPDHHDADPQETRSDLIRLRYMMEDAGIFKSTGDFQEFTGDDYDKAFEQFGKLKNTDSRIFRMYNKDDIIWLMNNMANRTPQSGNPYEVVDDFGGESQYMSKKGGLKKLKSYRNKCPYC